MQGGATAPLTMHQPHEVIDHEGVEMVDAEG